MLRPDFEKWGQKPTDILRLSIEAAHPRSRERFLALYQIGTGQHNATECAKALGRENETVMGWVHQYNEEGAKGILYQHSGGRSALFAPNEQAAMIETIKTSTPVEHELPGRGWTLKKLRQWVASKLGRTVSHNTLRTILKTAGLSWQKCKKLLAKANPEQRASFVEQFQALYERICRDEVVLLYVDEVHIHQDMELGYTWSPVGEPTWVPSTSPGHAARINWYGAYNFTDGACFIWQDGKCNGDNTIQFLQQLADRFKDDPRQLVIIWDGASYHRSHLVRTQAQCLGFDIMPLPAYSPDLNPIEGLWKWMREEVTQLYCHPTLNQLFLDCLSFIDSINLDPEQIITRLWPRFDLDPEIEKLRFSS